MQKNPHPLPPLQRIAPNFTAKLGSEQEPSFLIWSRIKINPIHQKL